MESSRLHNSTALPSAPFREDMWVWVCYRCLRVDHSGPEVDSAIRGVRCRIKCQAAAQMDPSSEHAFRTLRRGVVRGCPCKSLHSQPTCRLSPRVEHRGGGATGAHGVWVIQLKTCFEKVWRFRDGRCWGKVRLRMTSRRAVVPKFTAGQKPLQRAESTTRRNRHRSC
jgi:hypothetical protein